MQPDLGEKVAVIIEQLMNLRTDMAETIHRLEKLEKSYTFLSGVVAGVSFIWIAFTQAIPWLLKKMGV